MPNVIYHDTGDMSALSVGGANLIDQFDDVTYAYEETQVDGASVRDRTESPNGVKAQVKLTTKIMSDYATASRDRVSHLDLSAATLGATDVFGIVRSIEYNASFQKARQAGIGSMWVRDQNVYSQFGAKVELDCPDNLAKTVMALAHGNYAARNVNLGFTINGVAYTLPSRIKGVQHKGQRAGMQVLSVDLAGKGAGGAFPPAPVGTGSLLLKGINAWRDSVAFSYQSHATAGFAASGEMLFDSLGFRIEDDQLISIDYAWSSYGPVTLPA